jgi:hypothetical protein
VWALPEDQRGRFPALLNGLGKLQYASGDFAGARDTCLEVARGVADRQGRAEACHNAYMAAVELGQWEEAQVELQQVLSASVPPAVVQTTAPARRPSTATTAPTLTILGGPAGKASHTVLMRTDAMPILVVIRGLVPNVEYPIRDGVNLIGRDAGTVHINLEGQEPPHDSLVSRQHAAIIFADGAVLIEDLNSSNGTFVNHYRLYPGEQCVLGLDDIVKVGGVKLLLRTFPLGAEHAGSQPRLER